MNDFEFQKWERLSPEVTDGEAHGRFSVGERNWLFRKCGGWWFARASDGDVNFLLRPVLAVTSSGDRYFPNAQTPPAEMRKWLKDVDEVKFRYDCHRVWHASNESSPSLSVSWNARHKWVYGLDEDTFGLEFRFETPAYPEEMSSAALFLLLQREWRNDASELRFCAGFAQLDFGARWLWKVRTRISNALTMAHLLRCALLSFAPLWQDESVSEAEIYLVVDRGGVFAWNEKVGWRSAGVPFERTLPIRERVLLKQIVRLFEPRPKSDLSTLPLCVQQLKPAISRKFVHPGLVVGVFAARPTQHERLEAILELRAWLGTHWPDGVKHLGKVV